MDALKPFLAGLLLGYLIRGYGVYRASRRAGSDRANAMLRAVTMGGGGGPREPL